MQRPFICGCVHVDSRCGHMLIAWFEHNVQFGFEWVVDQKMLCQWFSMYWAYRNVRDCVIWAFEMPSTLQK